MTSEEYIEAEQAWLKRYNIKPGSKVIVTKSARRHQDGWTNTWVTSMNAFIGEECIVSGRSSYQDASGIQLTHTHHNYYHYDYLFPFYVLIPVEEDEGIYKQ